MRGSGADFEVPGGGLGRFWGSRGGFGAPWEVLGSLWTVLGSLGVIVGFLGGDPGWILGSLEVNLGSLGVNFGLWDPLGGLGLFGWILDRFRGPLVDFRIVGRFWVPNMNFGVPLTPPFPSPPPPGSAQALEPQFGISSPATSGAPGEGGPQNLGGGGIKHPKNLKMEREPQNWREGCSERGLFSTTAPMVPRAAQSPPFRPSHSGTRTPVVPRGALDAPFRVASQNFWGIPTGT